MNIKKNKRTKAVIALRDIVGHKYEQFVKVPNNWFGRLLFKVLSHYLYVDKKGRTAKKNCGCNWKHRSSIPLPCSKRFGIYLRVQREPYVQEPLHSAPRENGQLTECEFNKMVGGV